MSAGDGAVESWHAEAIRDISHARDLVARERDALLATVAAQRTRLRAASEAFDRLAAFLDYALPGDKHVAMLRVCLPPETKEAR